MCSNHAKSINFIILKAKAQNFQLYTLYKETLKRCVNCYLLLNVLIIHPNLKHGFALIGIKSVTTFIAYKVTQGFTVCSVSCDQ